MGLSVGCMSVNGAKVVRKWLLAPESTIAHWCILSCVRVIVFSMDEGVGVEHCVGFITFSVLFITCCSLHKLFAPDRQKLGNP